MDRSFKRQERLMEKKMKRKVYLNGKFVDSKKASISIFDHGLLYGDGVFEGIRSYDGVVFRLKEHVNRLYRSAAAIRMNLGTV